MLKTITSLIVAAAFLTACAPLKVLNALSTKEALQVAHGVEYGSPFIENKAQRQALNRHPRRRLDIYHPSGVPPTNGWPMVVFFYGGTWREGARRDYAFVGHALAAQGILTLVADYRLYPEVQFPDFLHDSASAVAWGMRAASRLGADPARVFVMGHSAGAYNAAMLALDPQWLRQADAPPTPKLAGWIGLAGPYDFLPIENPDAQPVFFHPNYPAATQPIGFAPASSPPAFVAAGANDKVVDPQRNTLQMAKALARQQPSVHHRVYPRIGHASLILALSTPFQWTAPVLRDIANFIRDTRVDGQTD